MNGAWNWRHQRTPESIFYHHNMSTVLIHSNTLHDSQFKNLRSAGYNMQVRPYNLSNLLLASPAAGLAERLAQKHDKGPHWYSHESDILRYLMVYNHGGVYMDTDMILLKNMDTLQDNVVGWASSTNIGNAFLKFKQGNSNTQERFGDKSDRICLPQSPTVSQNCNRKEWFLLCQLLPSFLLLGKVLKGYASTSVSRARLQR